MRIPLLWSTSGVFLLAAGLFAQSEVGGANLSGTVTDPSGAAVAGAKVSAVNPATGFERATATNEAGIYSLPRLPVGACDLTVEAQGFKKVRRTGIGLRVGAVATVDVALEIGAMTEAVTVSGDAPVVESTRSQTSTAVDERAVRDLPINGRNFLDFALLTPGVAADPRGGDLSFGGQRGTANSLLVDGGDSNNIFFGQSSGRAGVRNPYSFSQDAVQEFQVSTNGYGAEIGRAGGGVINVITKSGTNALHGGAFWFYRDRALNANTFINNSRSIRKPPYHYNQFGGHMGGPIKKDKLFFFYDYDGQRNTNPVTVYLQSAPPSDALSQQAIREISPYLNSYTTGINNDVHLLKLDWNAGASQRLSVRYNANRFNGSNFENSGLSSAAEHTGDSNIKTDNLAASYNRTFGASTVWDARFIYLRDDEPGQTNSTAPEVQIRQNGVTQMQFGRNNFSPRYTNTKRYQIIQSVSRVMGRHTVKIGGDVNIERIDNFFPGNFGGSFQFNSYADFAARRPFSFTQAFAGAGTSGPLTRPNISEYALFAQDTWRVNDRFTLNYGVRYDLMNSADPQVKNPDPMLAVWNLRTDRMNLDTNNFGARFGFAYKLTRGGRMVARGGYGIFYGRTPAIMTGTATSQNGIQVQTYTLSAGIPAYPSVLPAPPALNRRPDIYVFASDYVQPQTRQWSLNLETDLGQNYALTLGYLGVRGLHLSRTRDINFFPAELLSGTIAGGGRVQFQRFSGRPNPAFGRISLFDSGGDSTYHGAFVQLTKRFSHNVQLQTSYTLSKVIDTVPDATSVVVGGGDDAKVAQNTLQPGLDRAVGDASVKHRWVFSGIWDVPYARSLSNQVWRALLRDYQLSVLANVRSGRYFSPTAGGDPNGDGNSRTDRPPAAGRNSIEGPHFAGADLRLSRDIPVHLERARLKLMFEAFNLTNRANFSGFNLGQYNFTLATRTFAPTTNFGVMTSTFDARILQLAAKFTF
ncbi:MAG: TonB-dependent receptor [Acidobacteria bacterium]|nr:TonB-dependent receptor [Acidobacteriota bacterium]